MFLNFASLVLNYYTSLNDRISTLKLSNDEKKSRHCLGKHTVNRGIMIERRHNGVVTMYDQ